MPTDSRSVTWKTAAAALLVAFQAVSSLIVALVVFASAHSAASWGLEAAAHRRFEIAGVFLLTAIAAVAIAVGLASAARWARLGAFIFEAVALLASLLRVWAAPAPGVVGIIIAVAVVALLISDERRAVGAASPVGPVA